MAVSVSVGEGGNHVDVGRVQGRPAKRRLLDRGDLGLVGDSYGGKAEEHRDRRGQADPPCGRPHVSRRVEHPA
jgi:hypothetical protein